MIPGDNAQASKDDYINPFEKWGMPDLLKIVKIDDVEKSETRNFMNIVMKKWRDAKDGDKLFDISRDIYFAVKDKKLFQKELGKRNENGEWRGPFPAYSFFNSATKGDVKMGPDYRESDMTAEPRFVKILFKWYATSIFFDCLSKELKIDPVDIYKTRYKTPPIYGHTYRTCLGSSGMNVPDEELNRRGQWVRCLQDGKSDTLVLSSKQIYDCVTIANGYIGEIF